MMDFPIQESRSPLTFIPQSFTPYNSYAHPTYSSTSIYPYPSNYEYLPNTPVIPFSLPHFCEEQNLLNSHLSNGQEQQSITPSNNYILINNSFTDVNNNPNAKGQTNSFEYLL